VAFMRASLQSGAAGALSIAKHKSDSLVHKGSSSGSYANFKTEQLLTQGSICTLSYDGGEVLIGVASSAYCPIRDNEDATCFTRLCAGADSGRVCVGGQLSDTERYAISQHLVPAIQAAQVGRHGRSKISLRLPFDSDAGTVQISFDGARSWESLNPAGKPLCNLSECHVYVGLCAASATVSDVYFWHQKGGRPIKSAMKMNNHAVMERLNDQNREQSSCSQNSISLR